MIYQRIIDRTIDAGLIFIAVFAPLAFGSVHIWAYTLIEVIVFSLLIIWAVKHLLFSPINSTQGELIPLYICFGIFTIAVCLQIIPLPPHIIRLLSPRAYELYTQAIPGYEKATIWRSISIYPHASKISLVKFISYIGIFFLITQEIREKKRIKRLIGALVLIGFFEALYGLYGYFSKNHFIFGFRKIYGTGSATGTYVNRNHFAGYLGMIVFISIGYFLSKIPGRVREEYAFKQRLIDFLNTAKASESGVLLIMIITMILGIIFSLSRMGVFSFVFALLLIVFLAILNRQKKLRNVIFIIFSLALITSLWYGLNPLVERYYSSASAFFDRAGIWETTGKVIKDFPLTGSGLGTYETVLQRYKPRDLKHHLLIFDHAHNDYLEIISEVGIIGIVPLLLAGIYFFILILKKWAQRKNSFSKGVSLGGMGAMSYICLHSLTDFNMYIPANAITLFIIMALTYCSITRKNQI